MKYIIELGNGKMKAAYKMLRIKMQRFNAWEAQNRRDLSQEKSIHQFLTLYDLGKGYDKDIFRRAQEEHLKGLVETNKRLYKIVK